MILQRCGRRAPQQQPNTSEGAKRQRYNTPQRLHLQDLIFHRLGESTDAVDSNDGHGWDGTNGGGCVREVLELANGGSRCLPDRYDVDEGGKESKGFKERTCSALLRHCVRLRKVSPNSRYADGSFHISPCRNTLLIPLLQLNDAPAYPLARHRPRKSGARRRPSTEFPWPGRHRMIANRFSLGTVSDGNDGIWERVQETREGQTVGRGYRETFDGL